MTAVTGYLGDAESRCRPRPRASRIYLAPLSETLDTTLELGRSRRRARFEGPIDGRGGADLHGRYCRVAAPLLVKSDESHFGRMYPITGPEALTRAR